MSNPNSEKTFLRCELSDRIISLFGMDMAKEKQTIETKIKAGEKPIFILKDSAGKLCSYIDYMYEEEGISNKVLNSFKLCKHLEFYDLVTLIVQESGDYKPRNIGELISILLKFKKVCIVIENNDRTLLADILQQLIYIEFPINEIDIKLRKEFKDAEKTKRFMDKAALFFEQSIQAQDRIGELAIEAPTEEEKLELFKIRSDTITSYKKIQEQIEKANSIEMKIALAASKKTGKSVLANSMIEMEIAPTSLELATPNTCIYRKSPDDNFRLVYGEGTKKVENIFKSQRDIYRSIQREFKAAQDNIETKYIIPDMEIQYVSKKNNFDSYTIFDTPGPDAAGTDHYKSTNKAIADCDVAVFAIDYSKYLTSSEEEFLKRVKTVFEEKQKFHTLIFTINKIDMALQDKGAKSRIKSIDYIRNRIMELDNNYRDCVIFATSARDYFYTLELEDEAQRNDICRNLLGQDLFLNLRSASMELDDNEQEIKDLISRIDAEVGMLANQLGYREVYLETLKNYSGMPQLLSYISYIAKSKAREEIVNSITYMIDSEISRLQGIIDNVANIKKLINANESSIGRIREILNVYYEGSKAVLDKENLLEGDLESLDREKNLDIFSNIARYKSEFQGEHNINLNRLYSILNSALEEHDWRDIKSAILTDLDGIWKRKMDKLKAGNKKYVAKEELSISPDECNKMLQLRLKGFRDEKVTVQTFRLNKFVECLIEILNARNEKVNHLSEECRLSLEKEDCVLALPTLPSFDIGFIEPKLNTGNAKHKESNFDLSKEFRERNGIAQFFANLFNADISPENILTYKEVNFKSIPESKRKELFEIVKKDINSWLTDDVRLDDLVNEIVIQLKSAVLENEGKIKGTFTQSNEIILSNIEDFRNIVDDTEKYKTDNDALFRKQELIQQIEGASKDFISTWQQILRDDLYEVSA